MERDSRVQKELDWEAEGSVMCGEHPSHHPATLIFVCAPLLSTGIGAQEKCRKHFLNEGTVGRGS